MTTPERQGEDETARRRTHIRPPVERLAYTPAEAAEAMGMGESTIFKLIREGELTAVRYGTRTLVRKEELAAFLDRLEARGKAA